MSEPRSLSGTAPASLKAAFDLQGRVAVVTGGGGLLGRRHGEALAELGAQVVLIDLDPGAAMSAAAAIDSSGRSAVAEIADITCAAAVQAVTNRILDRFGRIDILVNNAARNPKVEGGAVNFSRLEHFPVEDWLGDIAVGLTGAFLCAQAIGPIMAAAGRGVIVNIASDLGVIAPDQRLYRQEGLAPEAQPVKPITYSVVKHGLIGLTRYLATYWAEQGVRCNALAPGGIYAGQDAAFLNRLEPLIPLGRMAHRDEMKGAIAFLSSDASSYMNGAVLVVDGGRSAW